MDEFKHSLLNSIKSKAKQGISPQSRARNFQSNNYKWQQRSVESLDYQWYQKVFQTQATLVWKICQK